MTRNAPLDIASRRLPPRTSPLVSPTMIPVVFIALVRATAPQERFFELLDMFKVVELEKGKPATFKSGGDERPVVLREKEFSLALVNVRAWGVVIEGKPTEIFAQVTQGQKTIGFDAFAHWALKMSVGCEPPEAIGGSPPKQ
jgi:hypothetical protein